METTISPVKIQISFDDLMKVDMRIGTILECEKVEKADKLLKCIVNIGSENRTIVTALAHQYSPENLLNKQVIVIMNLAPRKMRGIESTGMFVLVEDNEKLVFVSPTESVTPGSIML